MGIGIVFGGVVVLWAAFLLPWALRRYDEATRERPIETFSERLRVLTRRSRADDEPLVSARSLLARTATAEPAVRRPSRAAARVAARRRRRVLLTLVTATLVVVGLAAFSLVPWWSIAVPAGLVVGWLVLCRLQVRSEDDASWRRSRTEDKTRTWAGYGLGGAPGGDQPDEEPTVVLNDQGARAVLGASGPHARDPQAEPVSDADLVEGTAVAVPAAADGGSSLWNPLPVTLPTYVSAPKAARSIRTIDLAAPGTWTSGRVAGEQTSMPAAEVEPAQRHAVGD
ncbi:MAG: hypothetical protein M3419_12685 [Actinomycetota bacterium]|nr:hypothetical protein [Actinomycetota bacterium]